MSQEVRAAALTQAVIYAGKDGLAAVLNAAAQFAAFIADGSVAAKSEVKEPRPVKPKAEPKPVVVEPTGPTLDDVKSKLNELISANKRNEAVALFAEFSAKNASGVKDGDRAAFIEKADAILMAD